MEETDMGTKDRTFNGFKKRGLEKVGGSAYVTKRRRDEEKEREISPVRPGGWSSGQVDERVDILSVSSHIVVLNKPLHLFLNHLL